MSNDKTSKDFELVELEKPLTEQEMKETTGGESYTLPPGAPVLRAPATVPTKPTQTPPASVGFGYTNEPFKIPTPPPIPTPLPIPLKKPTP